MPPRKKKTTAPTKKVAATAAAAVFHDDEETVLMKKLHMLLLSLLILPMLLRTRQHQIQELKKMMILKKIPMILLERGKKFPTHFTDEQEQSMVDWLGDTPVLYNKKMRDYKDTGMKERLWEAKPAEIGKSKLEIQIWYKSIQTRYGRLQKKIRVRESRDDRKGACQCEYMYLFIIQL